MRKAGAGRPAVQPITSIVAVPIARVKYGHVLTHFYCVSGRQTTQSPPPALQHCPRHACTRSACRVLFWRAEAAQGVPVCAALVTPVPPALRHPDNGKLEGCRATALPPHPSNAGGGRPYTGSPRWAVSPGSASIMADAHAQGEPPQPSIQLNACTLQPPPGREIAPTRGSGSCRPPFGQQKTAPLAGTQAADVALPTPCPCPCPWGWGAPTRGRRHQPSTLPPTPVVKQAIPLPYPHPQNRRWQASARGLAAVNTRYRPHPGRNEALPATYSWGMGTSARRQRQCPSAPRPPSPKKRRRRASPYPWASPPSTPATRPIRDATKPPAPCPWACRCQRLLPPHPGRNEAPYPCHGAWGCQR